jgi:hypothetical protein
MAPFSWCSLVLTRRVFRDCHTIPANAAAPVMLAAMICSQSMTYEASGIIARSAGFITHTG